MLAYTAAAVAHSGKGRKPRMTDFLLRWTRRRQTPQEQLKLFRALAARQKGSRVDHR